MLLVPFLRKVVNVPFGSSIVRKILIPYLDNAYPPAVCKSIILVDLNNYVILQFALLLLLLNSVIAINISRFYCVSLSH